VRRPHCGSSAGLVASRAPVSSTNETRTCRRFIGPADFVRGCEACSALLLAPDCVLHVQ